MKERLTAWLQALSEWVPADLWSWFKQEIFSGDWVTWTATSITSFLVIAAAEIGDKSQIVCMTLAARHRGFPVLFGAVFAFALLNLVAVLFGAAVATWIPPRVVAIIVAVLFAGFGIQALLAGAEEEEEETTTKSSHGIFVTAFILIVISEFGDKTQIAVAGLSSAALPAPVWVGATFALLMTSAMGVWAGRTVLQRLPLHWLHRLSGLIFLLLAGAASVMALSEYGWLELPAFWQE